MTALPAVNVPRYDPRMMTCGCGEPYTDHRLLGQAISPHDWHAIWTSLRPSDASKPEGWQPAIVIPKPRKPRDTRPRYVTKMPRLGVVRRDNV